MSPMPLGSRERALLFAITLQERARGIQRRKRACARTWQQADGPPLSGRSTALSAQHASSLPAL
jgi:hypothetical protein